MGNRSVARDTSPPAAWSVDDYLSYLLARASHTVSSQFHIEVKQAGLTVLEWRVLATLANDPGRTVGELAAACLAQQPTVTKLLSRMQTNGFVRREVDVQDRRRSRVRITARGKKRVDELLARSKRHERTVLLRLSPSQARTLKHALRLLAADQT
jgi:MarR family transcriptional regulator, organic hydroperoxide resistance regulator